MSAVRTGAGYAPTDPQHVATKAYVDAKAGTGVSGAVPTFVQQTAPSYTAGPYVWYQTNSAGAVVQVYVEPIGGSPYPVWQNAVNNRGTTRARWVAVGDSISEGQGASARTNRWIDKALAQLRTNKPTNGNTGRGYIPSYYAHFMSWNTADVQSSTGSPTTIDYVGNLGYRTVQLNQGQSRTWTFTGTDIDVSWANVNNGATGFTYQIDGGSQIAITQSGSFNTTGLAQVSGLSAGSHTVTVANSGTSSAYINGFIVYNGDRSTGIHMLDSAHFGHYVSSITGDSGGFTAWTQIMNLMAPDMVTLMFGTNEYNNGTAVATFQSNYTTLVNAVKGLTKVPSIMLIVPYQGADSVSANRVAPWTSYVAAIKAVASAANVGVLDLTAQMPQATTSGTGYYDPDGNHPNDSGHAFIGNAVVNAMGLS